MTIQSRRKKNYALLSIAAPTVIVICRIPNATPMCPGNFKFLFMDMA